LPFLHELHIGANTITDAGLVQLQKIETLQTLDVNRTKISSVGLANLKTVEENSLASTSPATAVTDRGAWNISRRWKSSRCYRSATTASRTRD